MLRQSPETAACPFAFPIYLCHMDLMSELSNLETFKSHNKLDNS